jgi:hypothetical protein
MISRKWGFIVVYEIEMVGRELLRYVEVFTINGVFVRREKVPFEVWFWRPFASKKGLDFAIVADQKGSLYLFEVFYLNIEKPFFRFGDSLAELAYVHEAAAVVALSCGGVSFLIPLQVQK